MALSAADLPAMYSLLTNSLSADQSVRKPAEAALAQSESRPGFCSCLMEVIAAKDLTAQGDVRLMASVYFKNSINRYWRNKRDSMGISSEEKLYLRQKLLAHLREENYQVVLFALISKVIHCSSRLFWQMLFHSLMFYGSIYSFYLEKLMSNLKWHAFDLIQVALTLSVIISKIARIDYPREWPDLFSSLAQQLQSADILTSHRIFMIIFRTLKELSTKRLASDQRNFAEISTQFFEYCWHLWQTDVQTILHGFSALAQNFGTNTSELCHDDLYLTCERWFLCSKIVRQLVISGFPSDAKTLQEVRHVKEVSPVLLNAIQSFLPFYSSFQEQHPKFLNFVKQACTKLMKILVAVQQRHPYSFGDKCVLQPIIDSCVKTIVDPDPHIMSFEQFLIQCMIMLKTVLECKEYKATLTGRVVDENGSTFEQMKKNISSSVSRLLASLFYHDRVILLCNVLIRRYFVLTASDLSEWYQNPELFHHEQDSVLWSEKLRPCAEALYIVLFENHSQLLGPVVLAILQEAMNGCPFSVNEIAPALLLKDAAYGAAAYVYYELSNLLSFKDWFNGALSIELTNDHPNMRIIHRKVALILGQWVSEIKDDTRRAVYCSLIKLLQDGDLCVRLAACRSLYFHIEDANFNEPEFSDLLPICWDLCFKLIDEVQEFDSKVQVLNTISALVAHITEVIPFANKLVVFFQKVCFKFSL
nr:importin-11 isoform X2 [Ipomoea trifida]